jgi:tetratricopeptide (TPR) repeat protein
MAWLLCCGMSLAAFAVENNALNAGNVAWAKGDTVEAEKQFKAAIVANPAEAKPYARLAALLLTQNKNNADLFSALAVVYVHQQAYSMAQAMIHHALKLNPELASAQKMQQYLAKKMKVLNESENPKLETE